MQLTRGRAMGMCLTDCPLGLAGNVTCSSAARSSIAQPAHERRRATTCPRSVRCPTVKSLFSLDIDRDSSGSDWISSRWTWQVARTGMVIVATLALIGSWSDLLVTHTLIGQDDQLPISVGIAQVCLPARVERRCRPGFGDSSPVKPRTRSCCSFRRSPWLSSTPRCSDGSCAG